MRMMIQINKMKDNGITAIIEDPQKYRARLIRAPRELSEFKGALAEWRRIAPLLYEHSRLTEIDRPALTMYCMSYQLFVRSLQKFQETGKLEDYKICNNNRELLKKWAKEFFLDYPG